MNESSRGAAYPKNTNSGDSPAAGAGSVTVSAARAIDGFISRIVQSVNADSWSPGSDVHRFRLLREKTLELLSAVDNTQGAWSPGKGAWSVAQIADHLLKTENMYREQFRLLIKNAAEGRGTSIEISIKELNTGPALIPPGLMPMLEMPMKMFNLFVPSVVRETMVRYPVISAFAPERSSPKQSPPLDQLRRDLVTAFTETESFFRGPMPADIQDLTINHPIMGNNTIPELFRIVIAHEERHQGQISGVLANPEFPKVGREPMNAAQALSGGIR